ncbi:MAG: NAD(P)-dependent oxidoreductase [Xanthobacteraceae bacterium]
MKIIVTGGSGFLGSHIADALSAAGHQIIIFDRAKSQWLRTGQTMIVGDILDSDVVSSALRGCDAVFHLAAMADINEAIDNPRAAVETNIMGTMNVLEAARAQRIKRLVFSSSIYVFSNHGSFYRTTKQACENLINDYHKHYGLEFTVLRFGSLYGPRADRSNGVHRVLSQALAERRIDYYGTGDEVREYIHVLDAAAMAVDVLAPEFANQYVHLTGRERMTSRDMLYMIREIMGGDVELNFGGASPVGHYQQTPYNYTPKIGRRMMRNTYIDLGLGILDCLQTIDGYRNANDLQPTKSAD